MKKRIVSIILTLALCLSLLPAAALAAEETYNVWVGGVQVSGIPDENGDIDVTALVNDTSKVSGTVTFTPAGGTVDDPDTSLLENAPTLTLSGASITAATTPVDVDYGNTPLRGIYSRSALNLVLTGANTITASTTDYSAGVMADAMDLTISGGGSLKINTCGYGIQANDLVTDGVTLEITNSIYAISLNTGCAIEDSTVSAVGSNQGISTINGTIGIDNSSVYAEGGSYSFYGSSEVVSVRLGSGAHVKAEGTIGVQGGVNSDGSGYLRTEQDGEFARKEGGSLETGGSCFEYVGEGHYEGIATGGEAHTITCSCTGNLELTNASAPHSWNATADGATCGDCKAKAVASVTARDGTLVGSYADFATAVANWTDGATLTLLADVTDLTGGITTTGKGLVLDLNGHTLASEISIKDASELTIRDSKGGGRIEETVYAHAGVYSKSALRLESGTVKMVFANGDFTMTGGSIKNEDDDGLYSNGDNNNIVISGGEIYGGKTGISLMYSSNLTITGTAKITGANGYAIRNGSGVVISGTPTISGSQCEFRLGGKITLSTQPASGKTWRVEIDTAEIADGVFAIPGEGVTLEAAWFTSDMKGYVVVKDGNNLELVVGITEDMVTLSSDSATYNGSAQSPTVTVTWTDGNGPYMSLTEGINYTVSYTDSEGNPVAAPTNADAYTVTVTGMGGYAGTVEKTYTINPKSLEGATVTAPDQAYTGSKLTPAVTVELSGYDIEATDYDVSYSPDTLTNAGSYTITIAGKGNFTGTANGAFEIKPVDISDRTANSPDQITVVGVGDFTGPTIPGVAGEAVPGTFQYSITAANGATAVTGGDAAAVKASLAALEKDKSVVVNWTFSPTTGNYTGAKAGSFTVTAKDIVFEIGGETAGADNAIHVLATTYGPTWGGLISVKSGVTASVDGVPVSGAYTIVPGSGALSDRPGAGTHTYTVTFTGGEFTNVTVFSGSITVERAAITVAADNKSAIVGAAQPELTYTVSGLQGSDQLTTLPTLSCSPDMDTAGEYVITIGGAAQSSDNYTITHINGKLTVSNKPTPSLTLTPSSASLSGGGTITLTVGGLPTGGSVTITCDNTTYNPTGSGATWSVTLPNTTAIYTFTAVYAGDDTHNSATATCTVNVTRYTSGGGGGGGGYTPPAKNEPETGSSGGWNEIQHELADLVDAIDSGETEPGETVTVEMNGATEVPAEVLSEIAGKDVNVEFDMGGGIVWEVNGQDIPADMGDLNLGIETGGNSIPVNVINTITGETAAMQLELSHNGPFGTTLHLSLALGEENRGHWANLYYYDGKDLHFRHACRMDETGRASWPFDHASSYAVVIDNKNHDPEWVNPFTDVKETDWCYEAVAYVNKNGLMAGTSTTERLFSPDGITTRAQIVTILHRLEGTPAAATANPFTDVADGQWYADAVIWAAENGITSGTGDGTTFSPGGPITREQLAAFLYRYAQHKGIDVSVGENTNILSYEDALTVSEYAIPAMQWACGAGIIGGMNSANGGRLLDPQGNATRAQAAVMLTRFCEKVNQ